MKKITIFFVFTASVITSAARVNSELSDLLNNYFMIKNALVAGDAGKAATLAAEFGKIINNTEAGKLSAAEQKVFLSVQAKLLTGAKAIAGTRDISKQRENFAGFSDTMISLAKSAKLAIQPIYVDYCPMKKVYWLSAEQSIKNPYYGNSMLTCGSIKDTIK